MTNNDKSLMQQMIKAGKFNYDIYSLLIEMNQDKSERLVKKMGNKWCCHPNNSVKKLDVPLPLLNEVRQSKILRKQK